MATLHQNLRRPFYIRHLLERLRYGKSASAMRAEAAELIEWLVNENTSLGLKLDTARMAIDELKKREVVDLSKLMQDAAILEVIDKSADEASNLSAQNSYQAMRIEELTRELSEARAALEKTEEMNTALSDALDYLHGLTPERFAQLRSAEAALEEARERFAKVCSEEEQTLLRKESEFLPQGNPKFLQMASVAGLCAAIIRRTP